MAAVFFYLFSSVLIASAFVVISARNPVHSVLFLILAFCNGAGLFLLPGAEFLAMILIVVYVGAVAVLFLFVVMMLDVDFAELKQGFQKYLPVGARRRRRGACGAWLRRHRLDIGADRLEAAAASPILAHVTNTAALGQVLYTKYVIFFQVSALVLLTAMIGAIVLTLRHRPNVKRQKIDEQNARDRQDGGRDEESAVAGRRVRKQPMIIGLTHYLVVAAILFTFGVAGIILNRKNIIVILMSVELILLSVNLNFVAFSAQLGDLTGQVFALFVLTVAAAEAAIGLAILVTFYRNRGTIAVEDINSLEGLTAR